MKEITQQVLSDVESIKLSLEALSNQGIPIVDAFAPITTSVNFITTIFATAFGGLVTIQLFKRQEKMRIREELRLEFYKGYKVLYKKYMDEIIVLKDTLDVIRNISETSSLAFKINVMEISEHSKIVLQCNHTDILSRIITLAKNTYEYIDDINDYMKTNKIILSEYKGKLFYTIGIDLFVIKCKICELEKYFEEVRHLNNRKYETEELNELIYKQDETVQYIFKSIGQIEKIIEDSKDIHWKLEYEFLNQYFK